MPTGADLLRDSTIDAIAFGRVVDVIGETVMTIERLFDDEVTEGFTNERARDEFPSDTTLRKLLPGTRFIVIDYNLDRPAGRDTVRDVVHSVQLLRDALEH